MSTTRTSNIYTGQEAREALARGVDAVADVVKLTLGAAGSNAVLESPMMPGHMVTNDGVSIAEMAHLEDPVENIGANLIKEIASRSDKESGDGTTTATTLGQAIIHEGMKVEANSIELKRSLNDCLPIIFKSIDEQKKEITPDEVGRVAAISAEDENMGELFQEIYQQIGRDGIVELDNSNLPETFYEITEGVRLRNAGWLGAYSSTERGKAVYRDPKVLIVRDRISTVEELEPIVKAVSQTGKRELVIFCDEIDMGVASRLALTHLNGGFKTLIIKAPTLWKDWVTEDFARITGATVINAKEGTTFKTFKMDYLGTCEKVITTKDETRVIGIKDVSEYVKELEGKGDDDSKIRASWLQTKVAVLKLGANSETELSYVRLKAQDARNASYLALQDGVVPGGGSALVVAAESLPDTVGGRILKAALKTPAKQIALNGGHDLVIGADYLNGYTFDVKKVEFVNAWEAGLLDPAKVVKNSVKNAISVAGTVLTAQAVITLHKEPQHEAPGQMPVM